MELDNFERRRILIALIAFVIISSGLLFYLSRPATKQPAEVAEEKTVVPEQGENGLPAGIKIPEVVRVISGDTDSSSGGVIVIEPAQPKYGLPVNIKIPAIGVDAVVENVGITDVGEMGIPEGPSEVGWYDLGTRPGDEGSAVMAGHYGTWRSGQGSVFDSLYKMRAGDKIYIEDEKGETIVFVVKESQEYDPESDTTNIFTSSDGKAHLNLITCEGTWNKTSQSFSQRRVVFSDME